MKPGLRKASIRVFAPEKLASIEKERLLGALEGFVNLSDDLGDYLAFGKKNPDFFPVRILDTAKLSLMPLASLCGQGSLQMAEERFQRLLSALGGQAAEQHKDKVTGVIEVKTWTPLITWEPACHEMALLYRDGLRKAWGQPEPGPHDYAIGYEFLLLLGIERPEEYAEWQAAFETIRKGYPSADPENSAAWSNLEADWKTGTFEYAPENDFQRAAYILFREGWRAKTCARCSRLIIANKPLQRYCSIQCSTQVRRERNLALWRKYGKKWRAVSKAPSGRKQKHSAKKGAEQR